MPRVRPHVNPLRSDYLSRRSERLELAGEVEVEIGCADAQFLFERAAQDRSRIEIGLEIRHELIAPVNERARDEGVDVRAIFCNATVELEQLFAPRSLARVFVNFPDPWFKRRHWKRRIVEPGLVASIANVLEPGGDLFFQSDVWDLALDALAVLEEEPRLVNAAGPWSFWKGGNPYGVRSRREEGCEDEGAPIWRALYRAA